MVLCSHWRSGPSRWYFSFLLPFMTTGYLCSYRTTEVISHYAIWRMHNYERIVCNLFIRWDSPVIKSTAASFPGKPPFFFSLLFLQGLSGRWVCTSRQCHARKRQGWAACVWMAGGDGAILCCQGCEGLQDTRGPCATVLWVCGHQELLCTAQSCPDPSRAIYHVSVCSTSTGHLTYRGLFPGLVLSKQLAVGFSPESRLLLHSGFDRGRETWNIFLVKQRRPIKYDLWIGC